MHFDINPLTCFCEVGKKASNGFKCAPLSCRFPSDGTASMAVKELRLPFWAAVQVECCPAYLWSREVPPWRGEVLSADQRSSARAPWCPPCLRHSPPPRSESLHTDRQSQTGRQADRQTDINTYIMAHDHTQQQQQQQQQQHTHAQTHARTHAHTQSAYR